MGSTTTEETTVSVGRLDGSFTDPVPLEEFEERAADAAARLRRQRAQLSFDIGEPRKKPDHASIKIAGELGVGHNLYRGETVHIQITDRNGELVAEGDAEVEWPAFKDKVIDEITYTKRIHTATVA